MTWRLDQLQPCENAQSSVDINIHVDDTSANKCQSNAHQFSQGRLAEIKNKINIFFLNQSPF